MINVLTEKPLRVWGEETEYPWIGLPISQLDEVRRLLDEHGIGYRVNEYYVSIDEKPYTAVIGLSRGTEGREVQAILNSVG